MANYKPKSNGSNDGTCENKFRGEHFPRGKGKKWHDKDAPSKRLAENDIAWYMANDASLIDAAGRISFNNPLGVPLKRNILNPASPAEQVIRDLSYTASHYFTSTGDTYLQQIPGVLALDVQPAFGVADSPNAPINIAARATFSALQKTLSMKLDNIEAPDLMAYFMACDSVFAYYAWLVRIYGTIPYYNALNKYMGRGLLTAQRLKADDLAVHLADIRYYLRLFRSKANQMLKVPKEYGFMKRHYWLFSNYFSDSPVDKSQTYVYTPVGFYRWDETKYETGTAAVFEQLKGQLDSDTHERVNSLTWADIRAYGDKLLDALLVSQDANSIAGLILRAFGDDGVTALPEIPDEYIVTPTYTEEILGQIHNATALGIGFKYSDDWTEDLHDAEYDEQSHLVSPEHNFTVQCDYYQESAGDMYLRSPLTWLVRSATDSESCGDATYKWGGTPIDGMYATTGLNYNPIMDTFSKDPDIKEVIINSRNMMTVEAGLKPVLQPGRVTYQCKIKTCGLDIIWDYRVVTFTSGESGNVYSYSTGTWDMSLKSWDESAATPTHGDVGPSQNQYSSILQLTKFDWAPRVTAMVGVRSYANKGGNTYGVTQPAEFWFVGDLWDFNNATMVSEDALKKMHEAALMGAVNLPIHVNAYTLTSKK